MNEMNLLRELGDELDMENRAPAPGTRDRVLSAVRSPQRRLLWRHRQSSSARPRLLLPAAGTALLLVREATPATRRRPARFAVVVPATALAVVAAVGGTAVVSGSWPEILRGSASSAAPVDEDQGCHYVRLAPLSAGDDVRYLLPTTPKGWSSTARVTQERYCDRGSDELFNTDPVVGFVRRDGEEITASLTVFRSLAPNTGADPQGVANATADRSPTDGDDIGTIKNPPSSPVSVRSRPGRLIRADTLTWTEPDGQRWSVTSHEVSTTELIAFADDLVLQGRQVSLPAAVAEDYVRLPIPRWQQPAPKTWQSTWQASYSKTGSRGRHLRADVYQGRSPWQARLTEMAGWSDASLRLVDIDGRPGLLSGDDVNGSLFTTTPGGKQMELSVRKSAPLTLIEFAQRLKPVDADDPLIHAGTPK